jgi:cysteine synthase A
VTGTIYTDITQAYGRTPLVRLNRIAEGVGATVLAKLEFYNPGSSVKDRLGIALVDAAEASGQLQPGGTIVESTSGNTGIALALVGAARGYRVILTMPASMSKERRTLLRAYGAELVLTDPTKGMANAVQEAQRIVAENPGAVWVRQLEDTAGTVDALVAGIGTGGTITGVGGWLREHNPDVQIIAVEPADSPLLSEGRAGGHKIQGIGPNFVPDILDTSLFSEIIPVETDTAYATARRLATDDGIIGGMSSGAAVWAALEVGRRPEMAGKTIVVIIPDAGERYLSTTMYDDLRD